MTHLGSSKRSMRRAYVFGFFALVLFIALGVYLSPLAPNILALQFTFTEPAFHAVLGKWQSSGIALYRSHFPVDFVLLALYGIFGFVFGKAFSAPRQVTEGNGQILAWSLPVAATADALENVLHLLLTDGQPNHTQALYAIAGVAASVKWLAFMAFAFSAYAASRQLKLIQVND